jgi:hypothetical protein
MADLTSIRHIDIYQEDEAYQAAAELQKLIRVATYTDTLATAYRKRIITELRHWGMDGSSGVRGFFGSSDAARTADRVVQPLRAIHADLENAARNAVVFRNRTQSLIYDPIRAIAEAQRKGGRDGLQVNGVRR